MSRTPRKRLHCGQWTSSLPVLRHVVDDELPLAARALEDFRDHGRPEFTLASAKEKQKVAAHFQGQSSGINVASSGATNRLQPFDP